MREHPKTAHFDFALEFPQYWQSCLQKIKNEGFDCVASNIYWGLHESSPGIRDFSKSSKLKLEKFLQVASSVGLKVELVFGFTPSQYAFPEWVKNLNGQKALVPAREWDGISGPYFLTEIPSYEETAVKESFLSFCEEALSYLPLYLEPEGPIRGVFFDMGIYAHVQSIADNGSFSKGLEREYKLIDNLNQKYQTAFNSFANAGSKTGFKVLLNRRPWLASYDYKVARNISLKSFAKEIEKLSSQIPKKVILGRQKQVSAEVEVNYDGVFIDGAETFYPFIPESFALPQSVIGFKFLQNFQEQFRFWNFSSLPLWESQEISNIKTHVLICGKYLSAISIQWIQQNLEQGKNMIFPFGLPQFDQTMALVRFGSPEQTKTLQLSQNHRVQVQKVGKGKVLLPSPVFTPIHFKEDLEALVGNLKEIEDTL